MSTSEIRESTTKAYVAFINGKPVRGFFVEDEARKFLVEKIYGEYPPKVLWTRTGKLTVRDKGGGDYKYYWRGCEVLRIPW